MIQYYTYKNKVTQIPAFQKGCWVSVMPPFSQEEFKTLNQLVGVPIDFLTDTMDIDERSRYEIDGDEKMIIVKAPYTGRTTSAENEPFYITVPISIILIGNTIVTIDYFSHFTENNPILNTIKSYTFKSASPIKMLMYIFEQTSKSFMTSLKEMDRKASIFEARLYNSNKNEELLNLLRVQKSMVYFVTSLRTNETLFMKLNRLDALKLKEDEADHLADIIVDTSQALEMANIYTNILSGTLDAYASIIANNQNEVLRKLSVITLVVTFPTLVVSVFGMNIPIPFADSPIAFYIILISAFAAAVGIGWVILRRNIF